MKFVSYLIITLTIYLTIVSNCYAGFFDKLKNKAQEIQNTVETFNENIVPNIESQQEQGKVNSAPSSNPTHNTNTDQNHNDNSSFDVTGFVTAVGFGNGYNYLDKPNAINIGTIEFHLTNVASTDSTNTCTLYILDKYYQYSTAEHTQAANGYNETRRSKPNVKLSEVKRTKHQHVCIFTDLQYLASNKSEVTQTQPATVKPKTTLLSISGISDISGRLLNSVTSSQINNKSFKIQHAKKLPGNFQKYCHSQSGFYTFYRNPALHNKSERVSVPRRGYNIKLTNVFYADKKCYFDEILLDQSTVSAKPTTKNIADVKPVTQQNNIINQKTSQNPSGLMRTKNYGKKYSPNDSLVSSIEGYMLIGTINPDITMTERVYSTPRGPAKKQVAMFSMSDLVIPTASHTLCKSYVPDSALIQRGDNNPVSKKSVGLRYFLMHVRPSDAKGVCLYRGYTILDQVYDKSANLTQSDVTPTSAALIKEKDDAFNLCQSSPQLNTTYRCGCYANKYIQARKLFPDKDKDYAFNLIRNECVNVAGFTKSKHKECLNIKGWNMNKFSQDDFCNCYAIEIENILLDTSPSDRHQTGNILQKARSTCKYSEVKAL